MRSLAAFETVAGAISSAFIERGWENPKHRQMPPSSFSHRLQATFSLIDSVVAQSWVPHSIVCCQCFGHPHSPYETVAGFLSGAFSCMAMAANCFHPWYSPRDCCCFLRTSSMFHPYTLILCFLILSKEPSLGSPKALLGGSVPMSLGYSLARLVYPYDLQWVASVSLL